MYIYTREFYLQFSLTQKTLYSVLFFFSSVEPLLLFKKKVQGKAQYEWLQNLFIHPKIFLSIYTETFQVSWVGIA